MFALSGWVRRTVALAAPALCHHLQLACVEASCAAHTGAEAAEASHLDDEAEGSDGDGPQPPMNGAHGRQAQQHQQPQQEQQGSQHYQLCWIPVRIFLCAIADAELRQALQDTTAKEGLLPAGLPADVAARWWAHIFGSAQPREKEALLLLVKGKAKLQVGARHSVTGQRRGA